MYQEIFCPGTNDVSDASHMLMCSNRVMAKQAFIGVDKSRLHLLTGL